MFMLPEKLEYGAWARSGQIDVMETAGPTPAVVKGGSFMADRAIITSTPAECMHQRESTFQRTIMSIPSNGNPTRFAGSLTESCMRCRTSGAVFRPTIRRHLIKPFYLALSVAVEGDTDDSQFPAEMSVDWIRVYQIAGDNQPPQIKITSPAHDATIKTANCKISVNASDADGNLEKVEFYNHQELLATV